MTTPPGSRGAVLVIGTSRRAGPWAVRSVRRAGFRVIGADAGGLVTGGRSLACTSPIRHPHASQGADMFRAWLADTVDREGVSAVLATTEDIVRMIAAPGTDLRGAAFVGPTPDQYAALCDKGTLGDTAEAAGVGHPVTVTVEDASTDTSAVPLPAMVKTRDSGEVSDGIARSEICRTRAEVDAVVARVLAAGARPVVQEMLTGGRSNFHGLAHRGGVHGFATDVVREYPRSRGITSLARSIVPPDDLREVVERIMRHTGYLGPFSVQVIRRADGGGLAVHDVNLRLPATIGITITAGLDIPGLAVMDALGMDLPPMPAGPRATGYLGVDGEVGALMAAIRRRHDESPRHVLGTVRRVLASGHRVLDPDPLDPFWYAERAEVRLRRVVRPLVRRARGKRPGGQAV